MAERWGDEMEYFKIVLPAQEDEICVEMCTSQQVKLTSQKVPFCHPGRSFILCWIIKSWMVSICIYYHISYILSLYPQVKRRERVRSLPFNKLVYLSAKTAKKLKQLSLGLMAVRTLTLVSWVGPYQYKIILFKHCAKLHVYLTVFVKTQFYPNKKIHQNQFVEKQKKFVDRSYDYNLFSPNVEPHLSF